MFTNSTNAGFTIGPASYTYSPLISDISYILDGTNRTGNLIGINAYRSVQRSGVFHHLGDILQVPTLTTQSPYTLSTPPAAITDDIVERIPEQVLGLLKVGQPRFVIYAWGQALQPKDLYLGTGPNFKLCTNYQITAEYLTRTVCHIVGDPFAANPVIEIDSKNSEP